MSTRQRKLPQQTWRSSKQSEDAQKGVNRATAKGAPVAPRNVPKVSHRIFMITMEDTFKDSALHRFKKPCSSDISKSTPWVVVSDVVRLIFEQRDS